MHWPRRHVLAAALLTSLVGCWPQRHQPSELPRVGALRMAPDAVSLEIALAQLSADDHANLQQVLASLDTQCLPLRQRQLLDENGLQVAVAPLQLPADLMQLLERPPPEVSESFFWQLGFYDRKGITQRGSLILHHHVQSQAGRTHWIATSPKREVLQWEIHADGETRYGTCSWAEAGVTITAWPHGNRHVRIRIRPEVRHGPLRPRFAIINDSLALNEQQQHTVLDELACEVELRPGQTVILAPTLPLEDFGGLLLSDETHVTPRPRLLLVRLVHTHMDDLFDGRGTKRPLATPLQ